jgi:ribosomal protein S27AE
MAHRLTRKPRRCPNCGTTPVATILYGMPAYDERMQKDLDEGRIALGGYCIGIDDPTWKCSNCGLEIYKKQLGPEG